MWYRVESDKSTLRHEGETGCKSVYDKLRKVFRLPSFDAMKSGLSGDLSGLVEWADNKQVKLLPFTFENDRRIKFDLVPITESVAVGTMWYGASKEISATFDRTRDVRDILGLFYPHWLISYAHVDSDYARVSIREILEKL